MMKKLQVDILNQYVSVQWLSIMKELWYRNSRNFKYEDKTGQVIIVN